MVEIYFQKLFFPIYRVYMGFYGLMDLDGPSRISEIIGISYP